MQYFYKTLWGKTGPVSQEKVVDLVNQGHLNPDTMVSSDDNPGSWRPASDYPEFLEALALQQLDPHPRSSVGANATVAIWVMVGLLILVAVILGYSTGSSSAMNRQKVLAVTQNAPRVQQPSLEVERQAAIMRITNLSSASYVMLGIATLLPFVWRALVRKGSLAMRGLLIAGLLNLAVPILVVFIILNSLASTASSFVTKTTVAAKQPIHTPLKTR
jgi:hypothetical protein